MAKKSKALAGPKMETYFAHASLKKNATAAAIASAYNIEVRFVGGLNTAQKNAFKAAADRWSKVIVGDLPSVMIDGDVIDRELRTIEAAVRAELWRQILLPERGA